MSKSWSHETYASMIDQLAAVGQTGNCIKRKVGAAVISQGGGMLLAAANGAPSGMKRCDEGGCVRCAAARNYPHGVGYDLCVCLHAEQSVLLEAIDSNIDISQCYLATDYQPCFMCAKLIVGSRFRGVFYVEPWNVPELESNLPGLAGNYASLWDQLPEGCVRVEI
jgi:dCMP deaminase